MLSQKIKAGVDYSVKKYLKTYQLLEKYDKKFGAERKSVQRYLRKIQESLV